MSVELSFVVLVLVQQLVATLVGFLVSLSVHLVFWGLRYSLVLWWA